MGLACTSGSPFQIGINNEHDTDEESEDVDEQRTGLCQIKSFGVIGATVELEHEEQQRNKLVCGRF